MVYPLFDNLILLSSEIILPVGFTGTLDYFIFTILVFLNDNIDRIVLIWELPTIIYLSLIQFDRTSKQVFLYYFRTNQSEIAEAI